MYRLTVIEKYESKCGYPNNLNLVTKILVLPVFIVAISILFVMATIRAIAEELTNKNH